VDPGLREETRRLIASARACVAELWEEGVEEIASAAEAAAAAGGDAAPGARGRDEAAPAPDGDAQGAERRAPEPLGLSGIATPFGAHPTLEQVREELGDCTRCGLCEGRRTIVFGDGSPEAELMFVGEGPGEQEDLRGLPFVGRAGELLTQMIEKGLGVAACKPFLDGQIAAIRPRVIVALGKPATSLLLGRDVAITRMRGTWQEYRGIPVMPTFHPAFVLRQYTPDNRRKVWEDLKQALTRARA